MKLAKRIISLMLVILLMLSVTACTGKNQSQIVQENLIDNAVIDGKMNGIEGHTIDINFKKKTTLNTVILGEDGNNITEFSILALDDKTDTYETIYTQQEMGKYRYCAFNKITTSAIRIRISGAVEKFKITRIEAFNAKHLIDENESDFKVFSYIVADNIYDINNLDSKNFDTITDVILFGIVRFDENGKLYFEDKKINDEKVKGKDVLKQVVSNLKEVIGDREVKIHINILGPDAEKGIDDWTKQMHSKADNHTKAFKANVLAQYVGQFVRDYEFDGVFFDYEFPLRGSDWSSFNKFLIDVKEDIGKKKTLGIAVADWNLKISDKAAQAVDRFELMSYDLADHKGDHSSFNGAVEQINELVKKGIPAKKIDLGIPFYARPKDMAGYWHPYSAEAQILHKYGNYSEKENSDIPYSQVGRYYNGYQMVYDKTAYAMNYGLGGVMVWHYNCDVSSDNELSLFKAIHEASSARSK